MGKCSLKLPQQTTSNQIWVTCLSADVCFPRRSSNQHRTMKQKNEPQISQIQRPDTTVSLSSYKHFVSRRSADQDNNDKSAGRSGHRVKQSVASAPHNNAPRVRYTSSRDPPPTRCLLLCIWALFCSTSKCMERWRGGLIVFLCVWHEGGLFPQRTVFRASAPPPMLPSLHLILRQQGGLRRATTGEKKKQFGLKEGSVGRRGVELDSSFHSSPFFLSSWWWFFCEATNSPLWIFVFVCLYVMLPEPLCSNHVDA